MRLWIILCILFLIPSVLLAKDRCQEYLSDIRSYSTMYNGLEFPWWYNVGCAITETSCRGNLVSFDGGIGLFQLTPSTGITKEIGKYFLVDPYDTKSSIRAQSYYIMLIKTKKFQQEKVTISKKYPAHPKKYINICGENLVDVYRYYNSGYWFFYESELGKFICSNEGMKKFCVRGGTFTDKAKTKWLSFCDVSYSYPDKVYKYSQPYKIGKDSMRFYYE